MAQNIQINTPKNKNEFVQLVHDYSNNTKIKTDYNIPSKKVVCDEFTNAISKLLTLTPSLLDDYLYLIIKYFGDMDSNNLHNNLLPKSNKMIPYHFPVCQDSIEELMLKKGRYTSLLVFKGGNVMKYNVINKYLQICLSRNVDSIQESLSTYIDDKYNFNDVINTFSDIDFSYYIYDTQNDSGLPDETYKYLTTNIMNRLFIMREQCKQLIEPHKNVLINYTKNSKLHCAIQTFFDSENNKIDKGIYTSVKRIPENDENQINFHQNIQISNKVSNKIIRMKQPPNGDLILDLFTEKKESMPISFNNSIVLENNFDLFRIKLSFDCNNNYNRCKFEGELFDLSILKTVDVENSDMCKNEYKNTILLQNTNSKKEPYFVRACSLLYLLKDIYCVLFNQTNLCPWQDKKYKKRVVRMSYMIAGYIDEMKDYNMYKNMFIMMYLMIFIRSINNLRHNEIINQDNYTMHLQKLMKMCFIQITSIVINCGVSEIDNINIFNEINSFVDDCYQFIIDSRNNSKQNILSLILNGFNGNDGIITFIFVYVILLYYKLFVVKDITWCDQINNTHTNLIQLQFEYTEFTKTFANSFFFGMLCQNKLLHSDYNFNLSTHEIRTTIGGYNNILKNDLKDKYNKLKNLNINNLMLKNEFDQVTIDSTENYNKFKSLIDLHSKLFDTSNVKNIVQIIDELKIIDVTKCKNPINDNPTQNEINVVRDILEIINYFTDSLLKKNIQIITPFSAEYY